MLTFGGGDIEEKIAVCVANHCGFHIVNTPTRIVNDNLVNHS